MKVLIVDDSMMMRKVIRRMVENFGPVQCIEAGNGIEAVDSFNKEQPDIIFMDIVMPEMDGLQALAAIRAISPEAFIVMCSSINTEFSKLEASQSGANGYIIKPAGQEDIQAAMQEASDYMQTHSLN